MSLIEIIREVYSKSIFELIAKIGNIADKQGFKAYAVGGFVRDLLLKKPNFDIDIMVEGDGIPFATALSKEFSVEANLVERFHTAHLYFPNLTLDISSARKEVYKQPGQLPEITFSNLQDDLYRRDFSINALALSLSPNKSFEIIDFFKGISDLKEKKIRVLHPKSFIDDPTRLYRALRFAHRFKFNLEEKTETLFEEAIEGNLPAKLSPKRIAAEIDKAFIESRPLSLLTKYQKEGLLAFYHKIFSKYKQPDFAFSSIGALKTRLASRFPQISEQAIYWSFFLSNIPVEEGVSLFNSSGIPRSTGILVTSALKNHAELYEKLANSNDKIDIYKSLKAASAESLALMLLKNKNKEIEKKVNLYIDELSAIKPLIKGKDLIDSGIEPGPIVRNIFEEIVNQRLNGAELTRKDELDLAKRISNI